MTKKHLNILIEHIYDFYTGLCIAYLIVYICFFSELLTQEVLGCGIIILQFCILERFDISVDIFLFHVTLSLGRHCNSNFLLALEVSSIKKILKMLLGFLILYSDFQRAHFIWSVFVLAYHVWF